MYIYPPINNQDFVAWLPLGFPTTTSSTLLPLKLKWES